jgi:hypothetical protein
MRVLAIVVAAMAAIAAAEPGMYGPSGAAAPGQQIKKQPTTKIQSMLLSPEL